MTMAPERLDTTASARTGRADVGTGAAAGSSWCSGFLIALGPLTIDMYLPALPTITGDLQTTAAAVQLTLTGTLAGLALGQLLIGPLSDAIGRRTPLLFGVGVHILASVLCVIAPNLAVLGTLRVLQGLGAAAAAVVVDGDRARPVRRAVRRQAALPADAGDGRRADPGADAGRHRAGLDVVAWRVRGAGAVRRRRSSRSPRWRCPRRCRSPRRRNGGVLGTIRDYGAAVHRPVVHRPDPGGRPGHGGDVRVRRPARRSCSRSSTA